MADQPLRAPLRPGERDPWVIAHRGQSAQAPENTAAAFDAALRTPIDGIELDVQSSADGTLVIHHDATVAKLGGGRRRVSALTFAELRSLDAGAWRGPEFGGQRLLTLDELLERWGGRTWLLVEIKARPNDRDLDWHLAVARRTVDAIRRRGRERTVQVLSFDARVLTAVRALCPALATVQNFAKLPRSPARVAELLAPLFAISVDVRVLTPRFAQEAHELGKPVLAYTCNTPRAVHQALSAGCDGIMADDPQQLTGLLRSLAGAGSASR